MKDSERISLLSLWHGVQSALFAGVAVALVAGVVFSIFATGASMANAGTRPPIELEGVILFVAIGITSPWIATFFAAILSFRIIQRYKKEVLNIQFVVVSTLIFGFILFLVSTALQIGDASLFVIGTVCLEFFGVTYFLKKTLRY